MNSTHRVPVVRITDIRKHPNADSLSIVQIGGYQCVVKTQDFKEGDLAYYIQPDSVVPAEPPYEFLWADKEFEGEVPAKYRRITARKFRGEWSEGLLMPTSRRFYPGQMVETNRVWDVFEASVSRNGRSVSVHELDDISEFLGITHYVPPEPTQTDPTHDYDKGVRPRSLKGWFYWVLRKLGLRRSKLEGDNMRAPGSFPPVYDVEALKNYMDAFEPGEPVFVTEKIHGSNARYTFQNGKMYAGSRQLWKSEKSNCIWRTVLKQHPWIEDWCRNHPGYTLYGEVVPTQKGFDYGCKPGEVKFFAFDILDPDGKWGEGKLNPTPQEEEEIAKRAEGIESIVPRVYCGPYNLDTIKTLADGLSTVSGANHIREGVVIRPCSERHVRGLGRLQLKVVSNKFLEQEGKK